MSVSASTSVPQGRTDLPYMNASLPVDDRLEDLLSRMTLAEKAGQLFHDMILQGPEGSVADDSPAFGLKSGIHAISEKFMTHFNLVGSINNVRETAQWHNRVQGLALSTRLGIPVTISSDPRNHFTDNVGTESRAGRFSQWPEPLGLAALRSSELVKQFADIARQEYRAVGIRCALHPQVDLATEPRWARIGATFGEDAELTSELVSAYVDGFQGEQLGVRSVSTMVKHFPGGGPQLDGEDPHFEYGKEQVYPGDNFDYHVKPFVKAIAKGARQMMPYYGQPIGTAYDEVGFGLNKSVITDLLRNKLGFEGIVCTDWGLVTDSVILGQSMPARCWGAESLTGIERVKRILDAGCDQFGGESCPQPVIDLVESGQLPETRIDTSVRRLLREKFLLGLFDNPFVDVERAESMVDPRSQLVADLAQRNSFTLLKNTNDFLPLESSTPTALVYVEGLDPQLLSARGFRVVSSPEEATQAIIRLKCPYEPRTGGFEGYFHAGSLRFSAEERTRQKMIYDVVPTVVDIYLDRPAILPEIAESAGVVALIANYGSSADALLDVVLGVAEPMGKLPFDLPRSMEAVRNSRSDVPFDTEDPVFKFGHGLRYAVGLPGDH